MKKSGRPSDYEVRVKPHIEEIKKAVANGATNKEVAKALGIAVSTLCEYKLKHQELADAFARGRTELIFDIRAALLKKALGFEYFEEKTTGKRDKNGEKVVLVERYKRYSVPSETAAAMLMRNIDDEWRDRDAASTELRNQEADLRKAIAEASFPGLDEMMKEKEE